MYLHVLCYIIELTFFHHFLDLSASHIPTVRIHDIFGVKSANKCHKSIYTDWNRWII